MLRVDRGAGTLTRLTQSSLVEVGLGERSGLQELVLKNSSAFFQECQETLFVIREEVEPSDQVLSRIDLLAVDAQGRAVIIELKRGNDKLQLLQSLTYAAMISDWDEDRFESKVPAEKKSAYGEFRAAHAVSSLNENQRIILVAESYDFEVLKTAEWLTDSYGLNITCYQISLGQELVEAKEYLTAVQLFPPRALASQARRRGALKSEVANKFPEIEELLPSCTSQAAITLFSSRLSDRRNRRRDSLVFPQIGKMRFLVRPKRDYARVSQRGRFEGDENFWKSCLAAPIIRPHPTYMRFRLISEEDVQAFIQFSLEKLPTLIWTKSVAEEDDNDLDEE